MNRPKEQGVLEADADAQLSPVSDGRKDIGDVLPSLSDRPSLLETPRSDVLKFPSFPFPLTK